jgi:hypothetical protein
MDSILTTIKKMLGITEEYTQFDTDITIHINSIISVLAQIGVGPASGFLVVDKSNKWTDWLTTTTNLESVKSYIHLRVRLLFDPPTNSAVTKSYEQIIKELEWRILVTTDPPFVEEVIEP